MEETISAGQRGEKKLFFTETECREPRVKRAFCAFTFLLPYFVPAFIIAGVLKNTQDSISQPIPFFFTALGHSGQIKVLVDSRWSPVVRLGVLAVSSKRLYLFSKLLNYLLEAPSWRDLMPLCVRVGMFLLKLYYSKLKLAV